MPLGAAPGEGEITGLGHGMWAWFEKTPRQLVDDLTLTEEGANLRRKAETYKQALALVMATRRPALYLDQDPTQLERRIQSFLPLLVQDGVISQRLAQAVSEVKLRFRTQVPQRQKVPFIDRKATNAVRAELLDVLDAQSLYALDRYDLRVETSLDSELQEKVVSIFRQLSDRDFLARHGFYGERLLGGADPSRVVYSFSLYESTPWGNRLRVHADNLNAPLDINRDVKLELGSTAKLRTMANYLMVIASLYARYREATPEALAGAERVALDPITRWTARWLRARPEASLEQLLEASLDRPFSADPNEQFFTGQGLHTFGNFDDTIEGLVPLRTAFQHSVNLAYIRLMRELVQYYTAELGYDSRSILADADSPARRELLDAAMDHEARETLWSFYRRYHGSNPDEIVRRLCGKDARGLRRLAIFHLAEHRDATFEDLLAESRRLYGEVATETTVRSHFAAFAGKMHTAQDEAYLLGRHPLEVWLVRDLRRAPAARWGEVLERSRETREASSEWIERSRFKHAQDQRLRIELERRAFREIHKAWKALGYPFDSLVPSLATAIGSSADRPQALAELVGIIQNDGMRTPFLRVEALHFAEGTPYETHFEPASGTGERVMPRDVARALKALMQQVVREGTGRRVHGALRAEDGSLIAIGGKTGSGDNRHEKFSSSGALLSSRAVSRTASFVFVVGDRFFGMVSAYVGGEDADRYHFTSTLALQTFRALAPVIEPVVAAAEVQHAARPGTAPSPTAVAASGARPRTAGAP
jgi:membrane peptidoglycan carboxypeptidase